MQTLKHNKVIEQLRKLLRSAMTLKEQFDKGQPVEVLVPFLDEYNREFEELKNICPAEVIKHGRLWQHSSFLTKYIREGTPQHCTQDIEDICYVDIFIQEELYLHYLCDTKMVTEKYYDWAIIHDIISKIALPRFNNHQFADAVEASFKEINHIIKKHYKKKTGKEEDGESLMRKAFSTSNNNNFTPLFMLADNTTDSGRNIQQGYMDIFAGSIKGIRNPKAHANLDVNPDEAWEMIVLASHLMRMWEKYNKK